MPLTWNIRDVVNSVDLFTQDGQLTEITKELVFATMAVGLNKIQENNIDEWLIRLRLVDTTSPYYSPGTTLEITRKDLVRHIGLITNATSLTRAGFVKALTKRLVSDAEWYVSRQKKEEKNAVSG